MKKTILATLVALASGSTMAATMYENAENGVQVDVNGAMEVQLYQAYEFTGQDKDLDVRIDDGNLNFTTSIEINEELTALGYFDFDYEDDKVESSDLWVGMQTSKMGTIKVGKMVTLWDDTGIDKSYEVGLTDMNEVGTYTEGDNVIRYDIDFGKVYLGIATDLSVGNRTETQKVTAADLDEIDPEELDFNDVIDLVLSGEVSRTVEDESHTDMVVGYRATDSIDVRLFVQTSKQDEIDGTAYALEAEYNQDALGLAAGFYNVEKDYGDGDKEGYQTIELAASYKIDAITVATGLNFVKGQEELDGNEVTNYYVTATQELYTNVNLYTEIGYANKDFKEAKSDNAISYLAGMEVKF